jgi:hypothetical protein
MIGQAARRMPRIAFTPNLRRHLDCPAMEAPGDTLRAALDHVFARNPRLRGDLLADPIARRTRSSSPTGTLRLGEAGGARWRLLSGHLPPIAAVAFA